jgi:hypothetical protein
VLKALWRGWLVVARTIGRLQSQLVLTLAYVVVLGPFALAVRLCLDPLRLRGRPDWHPPSAGGPGASVLDAARQQF